MQVSRGIETAVKEGIEEMAFDRYRYRGGVEEQSIRWSSDPPITTHELTKLNYLFFQIACHSIWRISHLHTIPIERCAFSYALVTDAPMSFPTLFI